MSENSANFKALFRRYKKGVKTGYLIKCVLNLISAAFSKSKNQSITEKLVSIILTREHLQLGNAMGASAVTYRYLSSFLQSKVNRAIENDDLGSQDSYGGDDKLQSKIAHIMAGLVAGLWYSTAPQSTRELMALYIFVRALYDCYSVKTYDGTIPTIPHGSIIAFVGGMMSIAYPLYHAPHLLDGGYYNTMLKWGGNTPDQMQHVFRSPTGAGVRLPGEAFVECCPAWHNEPSCFKFYSKHFIKDIFRYSSMYGLVHFGPLLFNKKFRKALKEKDWLQTQIILYRKLRSTVQSCIWLSTLQHVSKLLQCWLRHYLRSDPPFVAVGCTAVGAFLASLFESSGRIMEYNLYMATHLLKVFARLFDNRFPVLRKQFPLINQYWSVIVFQFTFALWGAIISTGAQACCNGRYIDTFM